METKIHRTQIYLTKEQHEYLKHQAELKQISIAEVMRRLIDEKLHREEDYENNPLFLIGKDNYSMGRKDGSVRHDNYIYRGGK